MREQHFPSIQQKEVVYLDNGASTQKPKQVLEAIYHYGLTGHANVHRGAYQWSVHATKLFEGARREVQALLHAKKEEEIIFTRGTTDSINQVARGLVSNRLQPGDHVVATELEHHSNFVPWQQVAKEQKGHFDILRANPSGHIMEGELEAKITSKTKLVAVTYMSNVLGTYLDLEKIIKKAHDVGALVLVDAAQAVAHEAIDVQALDVDFLAFSGHKCYGPTGIGVLYGKTHLLEEMTPSLYGGDMIEYVYDQETTLASLPYRLEGGTPNIEGAIGLGEAIRFIQSRGFDKIKASEREVTQYAINKLQSLDFITIYPKDLDIDQQGPVISFNVDQVHPHDVASILDAGQVAIRAGHHCAQPLMRALGVHGTNRISFGIYNTTQDVDYFIDKLKGVRRFLGYEH